MQKSTTTGSSQETQKLGQKFGRQILDSKPQKNAVVLCLQGDLGAGKTTFLQGFAKGLGIGEKILSPTFVLMKRFDIKDTYFENFYHIDCYRIEDEKHIKNLGFKEIVSNPKNIIAIEWPEKISGILPKRTIGITFEHLETNKRLISIGHF